MNPNWKHFLLSQQATLCNDGAIHFPASLTINLNRIYPVTHLAVLSVSGKDAAKLLQGQMTCDVNNVNEYLSSLGAFCNPKGRAISTFLLIKTSAAFLLVLPAELLETVKGHLKKYVLRSDVIFNDISNDYCFIGMSQYETHESLLFSTRTDDAISITLVPDGNRSLVIAQTDQAIAFWNDQVKNKGFEPDSSERWRYVELIAGIPWLSPATSEEFIPQMLNLDKLNGISFTKGCYTGQEIVARTHYLGQAKREMFLAEANLSIAPEPNTTILDANSDDNPVAGKVLSSYCSNGKCTMLVILQTQHIHSNNLTLTGLNQGRISLLKL